MKKNLFITAAFFLCIIACTSPSDENNLFASEIEEIKSVFAPDKRVALFNVTAKQKGTSVVLQGESNLPKAIDALKEKLRASEKTLIDSIQVLPAANLEDNTHAVITISVANLRSKPKHSAELATQATLGTPVNVLKKEGEWYYIQTPDKYLSWVDEGGIMLMNAKQYNNWKAGDKIIYKKTYGHSYSNVDEEAVVSDLVAGNILEFVKQTNTHFNVLYPDGRIAWVRIQEAQNYTNWLKVINPSPEALVETAKTLTGVPYLWGGTSTKGMDCSGFTKTIYFLNGMVIPRDASQQVHTGKLTDEDQNFQNLEKGDLLFFGRKATDSLKEKVVHVGMWIGNNEFIHASNMVRISSIDPNANNFDQHNLNRYLRSKRILKEEDKDLINLKQSSVFK